MIERRDKRKKLKNTERQRRGRKEGGGGKGKAKDEGRRRIGSGGIEAGKARGGKEGDGEGRADRKRLALWNSLLKPIEHCHYHTELRLQDPHIPASIPFTLVGKTTLFSTSYIVYI